MKREISDYYQALVSSYILTGKAVNMTAKEKWRGKKDGRKGEK